MSIGISTACFYPLETELAAEYLAKNKIPCTEVFFNAESELGDYFTDMLIDIKNSANMRISAVHPMLSLAEPYMAFRNICGGLTNLDEALRDTRL